MTSPTSIPRWPTVTTTHPFGQPIRVTNTATGITPSSKPSANFRPDLDYDIQMLLYSADQSKRKVQAQQREQAQVKAARPSAECDVLWATKALLVESTSYQTGRKLLESNHNTQREGTKRRMISTGSHGEQELGSKKAAVLLVGDLDRLFIWFAARASEQETADGEPMRAAEVEARNQLHALRLWN